MQSDLISSLKWHPIPQQHVSCDASMMNSQTCSARISSASSANASAIQKYLASYIITDEQERKKEKCGNTKRNTRTRWQRVQMFACAKCDTCVCGCARKQFFSGSIGLGFCVVLRNTSAVLWNEEKKIRKFSYEFNSTHFHHNEPKGEAEDDEKRKRR